MRTLHSMQQDWTLIITYADMALCIPIQKSMFSVLYVEAGRISEYFAWLSTSRNQRPVEITAMLQGDVSAPITKHLRHAAGRRTRSRSEMPARSLPETATNHRGVTAKRCKATRTQSLFKPPSTLIGMRSLQSCDTHST